MENTATLINNLKSYPLFGPTFKLKHRPPKVKGIGIEILLTEYPTKYYDNRKYSRETNTPIGSNINFEFYLIEDRFLIYNKVVKEWERYEVLDVRYFDSQEIKPEELTQKGLLQDYEYDSKNESVTLKFFRDNFIIKLENRHVIKELKIKPNRSIGRGVYIIGDYLYIPHGQLYQISKIKNIKSDTQ